MTTIEREESGAIFKFERGNVYLPEEEDFFKKINDRLSKSSLGAKTCDFIVYQESYDELHFIEVKSDAPNPQNEEDFSKFSESLKTKFDDSLLTFLGAHFERENTIAQNLPSLFKGKGIAKGKFRLIVLITSPNYKREWLGSLKATLQAKFRKSETLFSLEETQAYNIDLANRILKLDIKLLDE